MDDMVANGVRTSVWRSGSGEPLVWVMGTGMSGRAWHRYQVPAFADQYECITYDMRGVGSADCPDSPYTPRVLAEDLVALLDALDIESAHLAGFSLGSCTIQEAALMAPDRVKSAVLLSTWSNTALEHHVRRHYEGRKYALEHGPMDVFRKFAFWMWAPSMVDEEYTTICELEEFLATVSGSADLSGFIGHFAADIAHDTLARLPEFSCPTLVVHGDEDLITLPSYNRRVANAIPGCRYEVVPRGGHLAFLEQPAGVNMAIAAFLASLRG